MRVLSKTLHFYQLGINTILRHKLGVRTLLGNATRVDYDDAVGIVNG